MPGAVTASTLNARIAEVEASADLQDEAKTKLVSLYQNVLSSLRAATSHSDAARAFEEAARTAPAETTAIREKMDESQAVAPRDTLEANPSTPLRELASLLQKEKADLAAVDARRAGFVKRLEEETERPALIRQRLTEAKEQQEEIAAQLGLPPPADEGPVKAEAMRWVLETRYAALSAEIKMLDQELLSQPARVDLLKAKRDKAVASVVWVGRRVKLLEDVVTRKRQAEADETRTIAEATRLEVEGGHPFVVQLAEQNAALAEELSQTASRMDELAEQATATDNLTRRIETDFKQVKDAIEAGGLSRELGYMLLRQRQSLPNLRTYHRAAKERKNQAAEISVRRLHHQQEATRLYKPDAYVAEILAEAASEETPKLREQLHDLALYRKDLLKTAIDADNVYLRELGELESNQRRLLDVIKGYGTFLDERLLWVRSTSLFDLGKLGVDYGEMWQVLSPAGWLEVGRTLAHQATHSPVFLLVIAASTILL